MQRRTCLSAAVAAAIAVSLRAASAYEAVTVSGAGSLRGSVRLVGNAPPPETTIIGKDNHVCGEGHATMNPVRTGAGGTLADAVVLIEGITAGKPWPGDGRFEIVQADCAFSPYVQVMPKGADLTIHNRDPLLHNIHTYEIIGRARRTLFNIAQPAAGQTDTRALKLRRGDVVEVACDAHNWMSAWIYTVDHPYWSVTAEDGTFAVGDVPPGTYDVTVWHPTLGRSSRSVTVAAGAAVTVDLELGDS